MNDDHFNLISNKTRGTMGNAATPKTLEFNAKDRQLMKNLRKILTGKD